MLNYYTKNPYTMVKQHNTYLEVRYKDKTTMYLHFKSSQLAQASIDVLFLTNNINYIYVEKNKELIKLELINNVIFTSFMLDLLDLKQYFT